MMRATLIALVLVWVVANAPTPAFAVQKVHGALDLSSDKKVAELMPAFLDHIYYTGPQSSHYDGERFYNPDGNQDIMSPAAGSRLGFAWRVLTGRSDRAAWPSHVNVPRGLPWPALTPCPTLSGGAQVENWANCARTPPPADMMSANWIGHASTLVQVPGLAILTDPVFSDSVGPFGIGPSRVAR